MKHAVIAGALMLGLIGPAAWAAESDNAAPAPAADTVQSAPVTANSAAQPAPVLNEAYFLEQADQAAKSGDREAAVELYQSAIVYAPSDPVPYERLAEFYAQAGQKELAQRYFGLALDVQPSYAPAMQGLAMLQVPAGSTPGAQAAQP